MEKLDLNKKMEFRSRIISLHCDTLSKYYVENIKKEESTPFYTGYLWDTINGKVVLAEDQITEYIIDEEQYLLFCDLHSYEHVLEEEYLAFGFDTMLLLTGAEYKNMVNILPSDYYLASFDCKKLYCFTHEEVKGKRYCVSSLFME